MTNNTIPNVPRKLLERASNLAFQTQHYPLHEELRTLLSAPSPAGVDGLEVVLGEDAAFGCKYVRLSDAQAIIDGLRGENERIRLNIAEYNESIACYQSERDQQAQRIGELEGLLRHAQKQVPTGSGLHMRIDAALSAVCAAAPNIAPTSEHKVPEGIVSITRSLGRAIVRFNTSEQLNEFYRAAKSALPTERSGQIRSTPR